MTVIVTDCLSGVFYIIKMGSDRALRELKKINVLGTQYTIYVDVTEKDNLVIRDADGVCDFTTKEIFIAPMEQNDRTYQSIENYAKRTLRHEVVHAILFESGLDHNTEWARNEEVVDWIAIQFPKLMRIFKDLEVETF